MDASPCPDLGSSPWLRTASGAAEAWGPGGQVGREEVGREEVGRGSQAGRGGTCQDLPGRPHY